MATQTNRKLEPKKISSSQRALESERVDLLSKLIKSITGGLIGMVLTSLFSIVVLALVLCHTWIDG
jgi:hypothetical protein